MGRFGLIGTSQALQQTFQLIDKVADTPSTVRNTAKEPVSHADLNGIPERNILGNATAALIGSRSWVPPPPPPTAAVSPADMQPPPPPPPPPQAYRFAGHLAQDGNVQYFVSKGDTPIPVILGTR